jgi:hypothetical protein
MMDSAEVCRHLERLARKHGGANLVWAVAVF